MFILIKLKGRTQYVFFDGFRKIELPLFLFDILDLVGFCNIFVRYVPLFKVLDIDIEVLDAHHLLFFRDFDKVLAFGS